MSDTEWLNGSSVESGFYMSCDAHHNNCRLYFLAPNGRGMYWTGTADIRIPEVGEAEVALDHHVWSFSYRLDGEGRLMLAGRLVRPVVPLQLPLSKLEQAARLGGG